MDWLVASLSEQLCIWIKKDKWKYFKETAKKYLLG